ncbi:MAG: nicotinate (nicotinamide) nucleotide adenylyltransferase [Opitutales bacterium]|nr:nicotinate (nicotinamide) nucleotide adenylyltransferase [Opitutales bacterium]
MQKIGIMGGSFDPPHKAHLEISNAAFDFLDLDEIVFVPAFSAPLKPCPHFASFCHRLAMLKIALEKFGRKHRVLEIERERGGVSYSVDTAEYLRGVFPGARLFWIIGTDQLLSLHKWRDIERLSGIVEFAVLQRGGESLRENENLPKKTKIARVEFEPMEISSTQIRRALKNGESAADFVDENVLKYIKDNKLYI